MSAPSVRACKQAVESAFSVFASCLTPGRPAFLLDPEKLVPLAIFGLFALLAWARPANAVAHVALLAWALLNLVGGGILSVLPLGLFSFEPEQSLGHYGAHVIYGAAQLPLAVVAARALRPRGRQAAGEDAR